jgi:hypothetical protein
MRTAEYIRTSAAAEVESSDVEGRRYECERLARGPRPSAQRRGEAVHCAKAGVTPTGLPKACLAASAGLIKTTVCLDLQSGLYNRSLSCAPPTSSLSTSNLPIGCLLPYLPTSKAGPSPLRIASRPPARYQTKNSDDIFYPTTSKFSFAPSDVASRER